MSHFSLSMRGFVIVIAILIGACKSSDINHDLTHPLASNVHETAATSTRTASSDELLWIKLTQPPEAPPPPPLKCWFNHSGEPPVDDELWVTASKGSQRVSLLKMEYKDPRNRPGQEFVFRYGDVPLEPPYWVLIVIANGPGAAHGFMDFQVLGKPPLKGEVCHTDCGFGQCFFWRFEVPPKQ
jgi:hypothetical protein